jgi:hypothetical protein
MKAKPLPPIEVLEECFVCNSDAGILTWKNRPRKHFKTSLAQKTWNTRSAGKPAGYPTSEYRYVKIVGKLYPIHRIVWKMATGLEPVEQIDHINGIKDDNRLCNLREATHGENQHNSGARKNSLLQVKGVGKRPNGKFRAHARSEGEYVSVGTYTTLEEAKAAYDKAVQLLHGEFFHP